MWIRFKKRNVQFVCSSFYFSYRLDSSIANIRTKKLLNYNFHSKKKCNKTLQAKNCKQKIASKNNSMQNVNKFTRYEHKKNIICLL